MRRFLSRAAAQLSACTLFLILSTLLWVFVFNIVTDTDASRKILVYADVSDMDERAMSTALETDLPPGIKMVRAHRFAYAMFGNSELENADIYIIPASKTDVYRDSLLSLEGENAEKYYAGKDGIKVYDPVSAEGCAIEFITYTDQYGDTEDYYLFFGANSIHVGTEGSVDSAAFEIADLILKLN